MRWLLVLLSAAALLAACSSPISESPPPGLPTPTADSSPIPTTLPAPTEIVPPIHTPSAENAPPAAATTAPSQPATPTEAANSSLPQAGSADWAVIAGGLSAPVGIANAGDGTGRLFVVEQAGLIRILKDGNLLPRAFLDITGQVGCCGERGLLGLAFHPRYAENGYFYTNYTDLNGNTVIARFQVTEDDLDRADSGSAKRLLSIQQPYPNHNGGAVVFGPEGYLYLGLGDGGSGGDPLGSGQSTNTLLGKVLRIDVDGGDPYLIPPDNPFAAGGGLGEIWAYGLRNPWRIAFDSQTGDLYIGDVGQNSWEEIDFLPAGSPPGANFGWNYREGMHPYQGVSPEDAVLVDPVAEYGREEGCSVTGGVVYRGKELPAWQGVYLYGDYCTGRVWGLLPEQQGGWQNAPLFDTGFTITSFGVDEQGEVYLVDYSGTVYRLSSR